jgi:hypothetical protein
MRVLELITILLLVVLVWYEVIDLQRYIDPVLLCFVVVLCVVHLAVVLTAPR